MAESDADDEFAKAATIIVAKGNLKRNKIINDHFSHVHATFWLVLIDAEIWYQTNKVPDLQDTTYQKLVPEKMESIYDTGFCSMCHGYNNFPYQKYRVTYIRCNIPHVESQCNTNYTISLPNKIIVQLHH